MSTIAENIAGIRAQMAEAAKKAGRDPSEILLCAATKMNDADRVKEAVAAGVDCCGENRVQEIQAKRPQGAYAGALIERAGLKGKGVGGAQVSEKHAGFIINRGSATSSDVLELCRIIKEEVAGRYGVSLETEFIHIKD